MSYLAEDLYRDVQSAIELLDDKANGSGALSLLPAGGPECEAKVAAAVKLLREAAKNWWDANT